MIRSYNWSQIGISCISGIDGGDTIILHAHIILNACVVYTEKWVLGKQFLAVINCRSDQMELESNM
jgi:hypothetical protein